MSAAQAPTKVISYGNNSSANRWVFLKLAWFNVDKKIIEKKKPTQTKAPE